MLPDDLGELYYLIHASIDPEKGRIEGEIVCAAHAPLMIGVVVVEISPALIVLETDILRLCRIYAIALYSPLHHGRKSI